MSTFFSRHFPEAHTAVNIYQLLKNILCEFDLSIDTSAFTTDSGANVKCALKDNIWSPCFEHRLHTIISNSWNEFLSSDIEAKLTYSKMVKVRGYFKKSSDKEKLLPLKLPSESQTRPWCGLSKFFQAFEGSYMTICDVVPDTVDVPSNFNLIKLISKHLAEFDSIFRTMEVANVPSLHLVIKHYSDLIKLLKGWPRQLESFKNSLLKSKFSIFPIFLSYFFHIY